MSSFPSCAPVRPSPLLPGLRRLAGWGLLVLGLAVGGFSAAVPDFDRMQRLAAERYGGRAVDTVQAWQRMMAEAAGLPEMEKLARVNNFFNQRMLFQDDIVIWDQQDYWATPLEFMGRGAGDCEDFSIAKYMTLRLLGIPGERLRLIYVRAQIGGPQSTITQAHMVLGYFATPADEPLVLDNLIGEIRPAARRPDLFPVFSFNSEGMWVGGAATSSADPTTRLSRWRDVLDRMQSEGLQ